MTAEIGLIQVERVADQDLRVFHTNFPISNLHWMFPGSILDVKDLSLPSPPSEIGDVGKNVIEVLRVIDGVVSVNLARYFVEVHKGPLFEWEDIEPAVIERLIKAGRAFFAKVEVCKPYLLICNGVNIKSKPKRHAVKRYRAKRRGNLEKIIKPH